MITGYYAIKYNGHIIPARWDGEKWHHEFGKSFSEPDHSHVVHPITLSCPTGCVCTTNPDGTTNVDCHPR